MQMQNIRFPNLPNDLCQKMLHNEDEMFDVIGEYPLDAAEKALILYLMGGYDWSEIHDDNKEDIFDYFDPKYDVDDFDAILVWLGYDIEYENDGTLIAKW